MGKQKIKINKKYNGSWSKLAYFSAFSIRNGHVLQVTTLLCCD